MLTEGDRLQLARFIQANVEKYTDALVRAVELTQAKDYRREDLKQIIAGYVAIMSEALVEKSNDKRSFYLETVIPGLVTNGEALPKLLYGAASVSLIISMDVMHGFPSASPSDLSDWVADYFASFLRDMMGSALTTAMQTPALLAQMASS
ncbi:MULTISPECIES: hypothetical protein [Polyangium]|uniref:Uncharacterized protein n=2 Tax=Polyangium TaxID=55 RepID=A0A4U1JK78_9BACT|nr:MULTISPECIES: hypothetical protein [Polyangium]MDI1431905.1 hypothetical protein [Polyangium sorediatum]TKD13156.1 hypothetical protein E8A74_00965 [Polyangium fumosum]